MCIRDSVGGPTANFRRPSCEKQLRHGVCTHRECLYPTVCPNIEADHSEYIDILRALRSLPGVKKVFIRSGIRFDYMLADQSGGFLRELCEHHISGTLKVAPEHISDNVLKRMHKPDRSVFERFCRKYEAEKDVYKRQVGSLLGSHVFHHKTRKTKFKIGLPAALLFNIAIASAAAYFYF